jgi:signal peptidase
LSPIFPKLSWFLSGILSILLSFSLFILVNSYAERKVYHYNKKNYVKQVPLYLVIIILIIFFLGEFKYRPVAIMSNSMVPVFRIGDAVIIEKISSKNINKVRVGTIIMYSLDQSAIIHRVVKIVKVDGKEKYITKGDNNTSPDSKVVSKEQVLGIEKFSIPKIGYPSVLLQSLINKHEPDIEK